jgi:hypothetical protein
LDETLFEGIDKAIDDHPHPLGRNGEHLFAFALIRGDAWPASYGVSAFRGSPKQE